MTKGTPEFSRQCKAKGMTKESYLSLINDINAQADTIFAAASVRHIPGSGMYHPSEELDLPNGDYGNFTLHCLRDRGMEFIERESLYRI